MAARPILINQPYVDHWSWRQSDVAAIARNFLQNGFRSGYAERKGWHFLEQNAIYNGNPDDSEQAVENLERLRRGGATHFVFTRNTFWWLQSCPGFAAHLANNATLIEGTPEFRIYKLGSQMK